MPCWNKLSEAQKKKVRDIIPNDWSDTKVFLHDKKIEIQGTRNGQQYTTTISAQPGGRGTK